MASRGKGSRKEFSLQGIELYFDSMADTLDQEGVGEFTGREGDNDAVYGPKIVLTEVQLKHATRSFEILSGYNLETGEKTGDGNYYLIDNSATGTGKTTNGCYMGLLLSLEMELKYSMPIIVIGPKAAGPSWMRMRSYGFNVIFLKISGIVGKSGTGKTKKKKKETPESRFFIRTGSSIDVTDEFINVVSDGHALVIFDEFHNLRNATAVAAQIAKPVIDAVIDSDGKSRAMYVTASPMGKAESVATILYNIGVSDEMKLFSMNQPTDEFYRVMKHMKTLLPEEFEDRSYENSSDGLIDLYGDAILTQFSSGMPGLEGRNIYNLLTVIDPYQMNVVRLHQAFGVAMIAVKDANVSIGDIQAYSLKSESAKIDTWVSLIRDDIDHNNDPNDEKDAKRKVIISVNYLSTVETLHLALRGYIGSRNPLVMTGGDDHNDRVAAQVKFQNSKNREIVIMTSVGKESISLHDLTKKFKVVMYISPSYDIIGLYQKLGRSYRMGSAYDSDIYITYIDASRSDNSLGIDSKMVLYDTKYGQSEEDIEAMIDRNPDMEYEDAKKALSELTALIINGVDLPEIRKKLKFNVSSNLYEKVLHKRSQLAGALRDLHMMYKMAAGGDIIKKTTNKTAADSQKYPTDFDFADIHFYDKIADVFTQEPEEEVFEDAQEEVPEEEVEAEHT